MITTKLVQEIALTLCSIFVFIVLLKYVRDFIYAFVLNSAEVISDTVSGLITVSAGTPGNIRIFYNLSAVSDDYKYDITLGHKYLLVERVGGTDLEIPPDVLEINKSVSTTPIGFFGVNTKVRDVNETWIYKFRDGSIKVGMG